LVSCRNLRFSKPFVNRFAWRKKCSDAPFTRPHQTTPTMNLKRYTEFFFLPLFFLPFALHSQSVPENCTNGMDDDGDGLIDCYDQDCTCTGQCDSFYYTTCNADCYYIPPCGNISLGIQWASTAETGTYSTIVAGDMDRDGIPEVVTYQVEKPDIYILDGATGATKVHIIGPTYWEGGTGIAIADLDHDGFGEIIITGNDLHLYCYEHDGTLKYKSAGLVGYDLRYHYTVPSIADMDHDGWAEICIGNQVFNGQTGALLAQAGAAAAAGEHPARVAIGYSFCSSVAMDVLPDNFCPDCAGLEIVAGNQVFSVNVVTGAVTPIVTAQAGYSDGFTSVADFDRDGDLDAIVQGRKNAQNTVYCWDIQTPTIMHEFQLLNNWAEGASRVNVADLDGNGQLDISFVGHPWLYALDNNFNELWRVANVDNSSITCSSVFDFCGDGSSDVIYRGQEFLQVIEGATGQVKWQDNCTSATHIENPLVLDVDADGQTEIIIQCGTGPSTGRVVAYEAVGSPGIASRKVWNQHAFFNTNINDDLSVPRYQQNPHIVGDSLRMNGFLNQFFNPTFPTPDGVLSIINTVCDRDSLVLTVEICNNGDNVLPPQTPISAYKGNPQTTPALWIGTIPTGFALQPDSCRTFTVRLPRVANDSVFIVLNDDHSTPTPFNLTKDFPVTPIGECAFNNNIASFYFEYLPPILNLGADTAICDHTVFPLNTAGTSLTDWLWQDGTTQPTFSAPGPGTYAVTTTDVCTLQQIDSIVVTIDSTTVVSIGPDQQMCEGESVQFAESGFEFYQWTGAALSCTTCPAVTAQPAQSGFVILRAGFANGCVNRDSAYVIVHDTFNYKVDTTICYGRTVEWNGFPIQPDSSRSFFLSSIHGCDSTFQVRVKGTKVGTFDIKLDTSVCLGSELSYNGFQFKPGDQKTFFLTAKTGCDSTVFIKVAPRDTFWTVVSRTICAGETFTIFGFPYNTSGIYRKKYAAKNGCDSTHTVNLTVRNPILLDLDPTPSCYGEATGSITASVTGFAPFKYDWNISGATQPVVNDLPAGTYALTVTDLFDCTETATTQVDAHPAIVFTAQVDSVECFGQNNGRITAGTSDPTLVFGLDNGVFSQNKVFPSLYAGDYSLYAQDIFGCVDTLQLAVDQPPALVVDLPADQVLNLGDSLQLDLVSSGVPPFRFDWNDSTYLSCANCPNPVVKPFKDIRYVLTVTDRNGCTATDAMALRVQRIIGVYVPNALSILPTTDENSRLELNFGPAVQRVTLLQVYDRWGTLLHEVRNALPGDQSQAWDGQYRGDPVLPGVYIWRLEVELVDGVLERYEGDVTVVR